LFQNSADQCLVNVHIILLYYTFVHILHTLVLLITNVHDSLIWFNHYQIVFISLTRNNFFVKANIVKYVLSLDGSRSKYWELVVMDTVA